jgi:hypothetical protein
MKRINCLVQEHMFSKEDIKKLEHGFRKLYSENYSQEKLTIYWMIFPEGSAYSERRPSNATIIMVEVNDDIEKSKREEMMKLYSDFLANDFNVSPLDSIITVANCTWVDQFFEAQQNRVHPRYRLWIKLKTLSTALMSKWTSGFLRLRVKY